VRAETDALLHSTALLEARVAGVERQLKAKRTAVEDLRRDKERDRAALARHAAGVQAQWAQLARALDVRIEGVGADSLLFTFAGECRFALDLSSDEYRGACACTSCPASVLTRAQCSHASRRCPRWTRCSPRRTRRATCGASSSRWRSRSSLRSGRPRPAESPLCSIP
jgi:hypothetical protein